MTEIQTKKRTLLLSFFSFIVGSILTCVGIYFGSYLQGGLTQRHDIANDLASYYSAAAVEFYSSDMLDKADGKFEKNSPYYLELYRQDSENYEKFISASTKLALIVPPELREKILGIEDAFNSVTDGDNLISEDEWFNQLDEIRTAVLNSTAFNKSLNPVWK